MNEASELNKEKKDTKTGVEAGIAGAGSGTLLILISNLIPDTSNWAKLKPFLQYLAPTFGIVTSAFWIWMTKKYHSYNKVRKLTFVLNQLDKFMNDPETSSGHKELLRQKREQIQMAVISKISKEVESLYDKDE